MVPQHARAAVVDEQRTLAHGGETGAEGGARCLDERASVRHLLACTQHREGGMGANLS